MRPCLNEKSAKTAAGLEESILFLEVSIVRVGVPGSGQSPLHSPVAPCCCACLTATEMERVRVLSKEDGDAVGTRKESIKSWWKKG